MSSYNNQLRNFSNKFLNEIDVIIVTYHTGEALFANINSVLSLNNLSNLIIINNGNPDYIERKLENLTIVHQNIKLLTNHGNIGFARGCNLGAKSSDAKYLLFLNPDCLIKDENILLKLKQALLSDQVYKVATCVILNKDGSIQKTCRRNLLSPKIAIVESFNLYKIFPKLSSLNLPKEEIAYLPKISSVPALSGAVVFTEAEYYKTLGGFDEQYFLHVEDMDFCMRVYISGYKIAFVKDAVIKHLLSTSNVTNKFLEQHKARGFIFYIQKYFPCFKKFPINIIFRFLIYLRYFIKVYLVPTKK